MLTVHLNSDQSPWRAQAGFGANGKGSADRTPGSESECHFQPPADELTQREAALLLCALVSSVNGDDTVTSEAAGGLEKSGGPGTHTTPN